MKELDKNIYESCSNNNEQGLLIHAKDSNEHDRWSTYNDKDYWSEKKNSNG